MCKYKSSMNKNNLYSEPNILMFCIFAGITLVPHNLGKREYLTGFIVKFVTKLEELNNVKNIFFLIETVA